MKNLSSLVLSVLILSGLLLFSCYSTNSIAEQKKVIDQAIKAYQQAQKEKDYPTRLAQFDRAEKLFAAAVKNNNNADLYSSFGNAALQAEHLGSAIYAYRQALTLSPNHPQAQKNLLYARNLLPQWVSHPEQRDILDNFFFWEKQLSTADKKAFASISFLLSLFLLAIAIRWKLPIFRYLAILPGIVFVLILASISSQILFPDPQQAVILQEETVSYSSDSINSPALFPQALPAGVEVQIIQQRQDWSLVRFANNQEGWIQQSHLAIIAAQ